MITEQEYVKRMLTMGGYTLVLCEGGRAFASEEEGIRPLLDTVRSGEDWKNAYAAIQTLGRAEALLLMHLKVGSVYAETAAKSALRLLERQDIAYSYGACVPRLLNAEKTGLAEAEAAVREIESPGEAVSALEAIAK
ncbi:MAG: DUF1893 domain-containing protein [Ruminococcus sp.]